MGFFYVFRNRMPPPYPRGRGLADSGGRPGLKNDLLTVAGQRRTYQMESPASPLYPPIRGKGTRAAIIIFLYCTNEGSWRQGNYPYLNIRNHLCVIILTWID